MGLGVVWLDVPLGLACLLAGLHHLWLAATGRAARPAACALAATGLGMSVMFVPGADPVPRPVWLVLFVLVVAWFGADAVRGRAPFGASGHHVVCGVAMVFMLLAAPAPGAAGHVGPGLLVASGALALAAWFLAEVVRLLAHPAPHAAPAAGGALVAAVRMPVAALVTNAAMAVVLVVMA